jgi:hypothetical protein
MNPRIATGAVGAIMLALGSLALFLPEFVMAQVLGFAVHPSSAVATVYGEVRATYGGLFVIAGAYLLWAALNFESNRSLVFFVGLLWLGAAGGRLFGVFVDGNPGLFGWFSVVFELTGGGVLVAASRMAAAPAEAESSPSFGT